MGLSAQNLLLILLLVLVIFGARKLPEIGSGLGRAIKNFKQSYTEPDEIDVTPKSSTKSDENKSA